MKKVLITGANSYIGQSVEKWLMKEHESYQISTLDLRGEGWKRVDFTGYDCVFHVAGIAHADTGHVNNEQKKMYYDINTELAVEVAEKAKKSGVRQFILMSTMIIYGDYFNIKEKRIITKVSKPCPINFYGNSKWQADNRIYKMKSDNFNVVILRPPAVYGKGCKGNYIYLSKIAGLVPIFPYVDNQRSMLYIDNLCEFVKLMIDNEEEGIFFPQNKEYVNTSVMVKLISEAQGRKMRLTKALNPLIWFINFLPGKLSNLSKKAFSNAIYDMTISDYEKGEYRLKSLRESIIETECK